MNEFAKNIVQFDGPEALAQASAEFIVSAAEEAIAARGSFKIALSGGSTPEKSYALLARGGQSMSAHFAQWQVFFGDERFVPWNDPRSNYYMADRFLLGTGLIPAQQIYLVPVDKASPEKAAEEYGKTLADVFQVAVGSAPPRFDLILLGLGDDGHTASLFPGAEALTVMDRWVTWSPPGTLPPPVDRVTFTYPTINAARKILFLAAGAKKAPALKDILSGHCSINHRPAAGVKADAGTVTWYIDADLGRAAA